MGFDELNHPGDMSIEAVTVESRPATIWVHVHPGQMAAFWSSFEAP